MSMKFIVVGCGRVGAELAYRLFQQGHQVTVIDMVASAFDNLARGVSAAARSRARCWPRTCCAAPASRGRRPGRRHQLRHAQRRGRAHRAHRLPRAERRRAQLRPALAPALRGLRPPDRQPDHLGRAAHRGAALRRSLRTVFSAGNGEVEVYEMIVPAAWDGRRLGELCPQRLRARRPHPRGQGRAADGRHHSSRRATSCT